MNDTSKLIIEPLGRNHDRLSFNCGVRPLNSYLQKQANQDIKRRISRVFVATMQDNPNSIVGYYTLSTLSIELTHLPETAARKLPKHPIPAALLGRLAINKINQGCGVGRMLLVDSIKRCLAISDQIAIYAMVVDAISPDAHAFYQQFGFTTLNSNEKRLFIPLKSLDQSESAD